MSRSSSCFEVMPRSRDREFVDLLEAPKFTSFSHMLTVNESKNFEFPWFADLRYCWNLSLPHNYPSVQSSVFNSDR